MARDICLADRFPSPPPPPQCHSHSGDHEETFLVCMWLFASGAAVARVLLLPLDDLLLLHFALFIAITYVVEIDNIIDIIVVDASPARVVVVGAVG
jgi:hypothetical protein